MSAIHTTMLLQAMTKAIPETMWTSELEGAGFDSLRVVERPVPRPGPSQVLCRVEAASICRSDAGLVRLGGRHRSLFGWDPVRAPLVPGHEGSLVVVAVGKAIGHRLRVGQRLVVHPDVPGPPRFDGDRYGQPLETICRVSLGFTIPGLLSQYVLLREDVLDAPGAVIAVDASPRSLPHFGAALAEPFSTVVAAHALMVHVLSDPVAGERTYRAGILPGGVTVVIGAGP